ncbi:AAA family ATPase [Streptomyces abikoensis]|uniref:AAA family ATPase n=1 Tax=Streptomyces abikoensis TaxID=97398 RepID=UPI0033D9332D
MTYPHSPEPRPGADAWVAAVHLTEQDKRPLGSGFLIDDRRVVTCAHVAWPAWIRHKELWVAFPMAEELMDHRVRVQEVIAPPEADHEIKDAAVLVLARKLPPGMAARLRQPVSADLVGAQWWAFGFPDGPLGNSSSGSVGEALGYGWARLDSGEGYPVKGGYSGAAVWSSAYQAVVGMVGQAHSATGDGRALSLRAISAALPGENIHLLTDWSLEAADSTARKAWGWALGSDPETRRHWQPRARGTSTASERGFRFRGRTTALTEIIQWITEETPRRQALIVTGSPGSGKSAVLGRIVTTADTDAAAALPGDDMAVRAPLGVISCAVHAKAKTALEVAHEIARAASAALPPQVSDLAVVLREALEDRPPQPFVLVIDALDEATTPEDARGVATNIVVPLVETCADLGVRVVIGARRRDDAGDLLAVFGPAGRVLDLDSSTYFAQDDLTAYAMATLQLVGDERSDTPYAAHESAWPVAERIAILAEGNFLVAGLVARAHGMHDQQAVDPAQVSFPTTVDTALRDYLTLLPAIGGLPAADVLTALAYAEGPGLPTELWHEAIAALFDEAPEPAELLRFARSSAANFLIESSTPETSKEVFRLFHQALNESLSRARGQVASRIADERAITYAFMGEGQRRGWSAAPPYLTRSLPLHAVRGGVVDELLSDESYPLYADLRRLVPLAARAQTRYGVEIARLLRLTPRAIDAPAPVRAALFSVTEVQERLCTSYRRSELPLPYRAEWANVVPLRHQVATLEGHAAGIDALCTARVDGRVLLVSASGDQTIRTWDAITGEPVQTMTGHEGWVSSACTVLLDGQSLVASAGAEGVVRLWELSTGRVARTMKGHDHAIDALCSFELAGRVLVASAGRDRRVQVWDPATGETVQTFRGRTRHTNNICAISVGGQTRLALMASDFGKPTLLRIWDPITGKVTRTITTRGGSFGRLCAVEGVGQPLLAMSWGATENDGVLLIDPRTGRRIRWLDGGDGGIYSLTSLTLHGRPALAAGYGEEESGSLVIWDPATGRMTHRLNGHSGWVGALCTVEVNDRTLIVSGSEDRTITLWNAERQHGREDADESIGRVSELVSLDTEGRTLVAGATDRNSVTIWDPLTGNPHRSLNGFSEWIGAFCTVRVEGRSYLAVGSEDDEKTGVIHVVDPATGSTVRTLRSEGCRPRAMTAVQLKGKDFLAVASVCTHKKHGVQIWDMDHNAITSTLKSNSSFVHGLCGITAGQRTLLAVNSSSLGDEGYIQLWDLESSRPRKLPLTDTSYSPMHATEVDSRKVIAIAQNIREVMNEEVRQGWIALSDLLTGNITRRRKVHSGWINSLCTVEMNGHKFLATAGQEEREVRLFSMDTLQKVLEIPVRQPVYAVVQVGDKLIVGLENGLMAVALPNGHREPRGLVQRIQPTGPAVDGVS